ncbi:MAG TPA: hypothetical protein VK099_04580 [Alcanivoracaceae bacterium]|nr:hypothetical protein [Alcanivoracaceae bacterium]
MVRSFLRLATIGGVAAGLSACGMVYKTTGDVLVSYGSSKMVPYLMETNDVGMSCAMGESLTPLLLSFESVGSKPQKLGTLVYTTAAACSEERALSAELRYLRAMNNGNVDEARDARIEQQRHAELAAHRQLRGYESAKHVYGEATNDSCPKLRKDFDELVWLIGQVNGLQALLNDSVANGSVGVSRDVLAKVNRGVACLDNTKWWGAPNAIRGAIWTILPMLGPEGVDSWAMLENSVETGLAAGVRLPSALYVMTAYNVNDQERMRDSIRKFANTTNKLSDEYQLIDAIAEQMIYSVSDRLWTDATGQRTPFGELGTFWDDVKVPEDDGFDVNDFL